METAFIIYFTASYSCIKTTKTTFPKTKTETEVQFTNGIVYTSFEDLT